MRCDFNVPLDERGNVLDSNPPTTPQYIISDDFRIKQTIPTIEYLIKKGAKVILMSHLGRSAQNQKSKIKNQKYSLKPVAKRLEKLLEWKIKFLDDCIGEKVKKETEKMKPGKVVVLENLRIHKEEEENDENFAKELSKLGDIYINDAFGASHRAHASMVGIPKYLPSGAGFLLEKEINVLTNLMKNPKKPLVVIIGGKKVEMKAKLINKFSEIADVLLVGGLIKKEIEGKRIKLKYPQKIVEPIDEIEGKDIGPKTINLFQEKIKKAKTIFWNGPLGMIEREEFSKGTRKIARAIIKSGAFSVIGGGETVEFLNKIGLIDKFNHVSTGGGAMLAFLSGEKLPGIEALK